MNRVLKYLISLCATVALLAGATFLLFSPEYYKKSYKDSSELQLELNNFIAQLGVYVLDTPTEKEAIKELSVSDEEIQNYRELYGSLENQKESINYQYQDRINEAKNTKSTKVYQALVEERDSKIKDITRNFKEKNYVKEKILVEKKKMVAEFYDNLPNNIENIKVNSNYFSYDLTNIETGVEYKSGTISKNTLFKKEYGSNNPALKITSNGSDFLTDPDTELAFETKNFTKNFPIYNHGYSGTIAINESQLTTENAKSDNLVSNYEDFTTIQKLLNILWISGIIALIIGLPLLWLKKKDYRRYIIPIELQISMLIVLAIASFATFVGFEENIQSIKNATMVLATLSFFLLWILLYWGMNLLVSIYYNLRDIQQVWTRSLMKKVVKIVNNLVLKMSLFIKVLLYLIIIFLAGFGFLFMMQNNYSLAVVLFYCFLFIVVVIPTSYLFFKNLGYLSLIVSKTDEMVHNQNNEDIEIQGSSVLAKHASNLNQMRIGIEHSVSEQNKSERLKTELITNVSHDLRTPLTSIITYTELLKKDDLSEEERKQYISVLDKKSQRLRVLIDDLFEVSKMTSGNIDLQKTKVDVSQLLKQALGEHETEIEEARLKVNMSIPDQAVAAIIDGQKYWRVIDNLVGNAIKYSLEGTRVFVSLKDLGSVMEITVKNVSKYEISENVDELYERFKRADASRHTEGSGLGLAIAQSIVELHGGKMKIEIDGDLFKVTVKQPK